MDAAAGEEALGSASSVGEPLPLAVSYKVHGSLDSLQHGALYWRTEAR